MKLPRTAVIVAALTASTATALAWAHSTFHWSDLQTTAVSVVGASSIALAGFIAEHLRKETPSRWVGVLGLVPAEVTSVVGLGIAFAWWGESATKIGGAVIGAVTFLASLAGVAVAQGKVTSPETLARELEATAIEVAAAKNVDPAVHAL